MRSSTDILVAGLATLLVATPAAAAPALVDRIAAVFEDQIVTMRELEEKAAPYMAQLDNIPEPSKREQKRLELLRQVLDIEIGERLVTSQINQNRDKLGVSDKDIDNAIDEVQRMNRLNRDQLQAALYGQGMTWSEYRKKLQEQIERARLIQFKVQGKVQIKDADVRRRCLQRKSAGTTEPQVCASHVLLAVKNGTSEADQSSIHAKASKLQAELSSGADFASYALQYSDDKSAPDGKLGCFGRGEMVEAFEKTAYETPVGKVSAVVRTEFGFHIIKVTERRAPATPCEDESALIQFKNELYQEEMERQMSLWVDELRKKAFVEVRF